MGMLINIHGKYNNENAVENVIRYTTRTRDNEQRLAELHGYGGMGILNSGTIEMIVFQFKTVQEAYGINYRKGRRIFHEVFSLTDSEFKGLNFDFNLVNQIAMELCQEYYNQGFQVVYAVHWDNEKKLHIHFTVNAINFRTGKKFDTSIRGNVQREELFNQILHSYSNPVASLDDLTY